jgi:DtxR family Mn-dependent transcriptional regulator
MSELIDTTEMYLKVVFELEEQRQPALRARLSERLEQAMPSVSQTVSRMERDGLLTLDDQRVIRLTETGRSLAVAVMRKHRVAERFLFDVLGLEWVELHEEACRWEHVLGDHAEAKLISLLKNLDSDPYGNPIPGSELIGLSKGRPTVAGQPLSDFASNADGLTLVAIGEGIQAEANLLNGFAKAGLMPGAKAKLTVENDGFRLTGDGGSVLLDSHLATQLFVAPA